MQELFYLDVFVIVLSASTLLCVCIVKSPLA